MPRDAEKYPTHPALHLAAEVPTSARCICPPWRTPHKYPAADAMMEIRSMQCIHIECKQKTQTAKMIAKLYNFLFEHLLKGGMKKLASEDLGLFSITFNLQLF